jgi:hypothetical protein
VEGSSGRQQLVVVGEVGNQTAKDSRKMNQNICQETIIKNLLDVV